LKSESLNLLEPSGPVQACNGTALPFYLLNKTRICLQNLNKVLGSFLINFPRIVTGFQAKQKLGYLRSLADNVVGDFIPDV
jgi:hypothetical protein